MTVNSLQPTLLCVIALFVCLSSLYDQDVPLLEVVILSVIIFVVPNREYVGMEVGRIWRLAMEPRRGKRNHRISQRRRGDKEQSCNMLNDGAW